MISAWRIVTIIAAALVFILLAATVIVLVRPHAGHRGPAHWEAATIMLLAALALDVLASVGYATVQALERGGSS